MNAPAHASLTEAQFRASVVGASEVAALFDCSPYLTKFELWHRKKGNIATPEFNARHDNGMPDDERILWGVGSKPRSSKRRRSATATSTASKSSG
jgi:hypothetical protein